jgi:hypothetical protein
VTQLLPELIERRYFMQLTRSHCINNNCPFYFSPPTLASGKRDDCHYNKKANLHQVRPVRAKK